MAISKKGKTGRQLLQELQKKQTEALYYIAGDDLFVVEEVLEQFKHLVEPAWKDFNLYYYIASEISGSQLVSTCNQLPMMSSKVVVIVKDIQSWKSDEWTSFSSYLENPSPTTCLVFLDSNPKSSLDKRTKMGKALTAFVYECSKPYDNSMPQWVRERAQKHQIEINQDATLLLLELLGTDLASLDNALERLALFLGGKGQITEQTVQTVITESRSYNLFELSEWVANKDPQKALKLFQGLLQTGEAPLKLLALMARTFRQLLLARVDLQSGASYQVLENTYISPKIRFNRDQHFQRLLRQIKLFQVSDLSEAMQKIHETDRLLKSTSGLTPEILMERLILQLCQSSETIGK